MKKEKKLKGGCLNLVVLLLRRLLILHLLDHGRLLSIVNLLVPVFADTEVEGVLIPGEGAKLEKEMVFFETHILHEKKF